MFKTFSIILIFAVLSIFIPLVIYLLYKEYIRYTELKDLEKSGSNVDIISYIDDKVSQLELPNPEKIKINFIESLPINLYDLEERTKHDLEILEDISNGLYDHHEINNDLSKIKSSFSENDDILKCIRNRSKLLSDLDNMKEKLIRYYDDYSESYFNLEVTDNLKTNLYLCKEKLITFQNSLFDYNELYKKLF